MRGRNRPSLRLALALVAVFTVGGAGTVLAVGTPPWKAPPFTAIGIETIHLDASHRETGSPSVVAAFVETGSSNSRCLATLHELGGQAMPFAVFCAPRNPTFDGTSYLEGVWLHIFFFEDPGENLILDVNVYQEGAKFYGEPLLCEGAQGC